MSEKNLTSTQESLRQPWEEHLRHEFETKNTEETLAMMVEDAHVNYVPVMTGAVGKEGLPEFSSKRFISQMPPDVEITLISPQSSSPECRRWDIAAKGLTRATTRRRR